MLTHSRCLVQTYILTMFLALAISCATNQNKDGESKYPATKIKDLQTVFEGDIRKNEILKKIDQFERALQNRGSQLTDSDWKLHDELLAIYIQLKSLAQEPSKINVPPRSKLKVDLLGFCLNSNQAAPSQREAFKWVRNDPSIPYYREILGLVAKHEIEQVDGQTLLWNLQNKTYWENYPDHLKTILQKIDRNASIKLPSQIKKKIQNSAVEFLKEQIPFAGKIEDTISLVEGEYYKYDDYARSVQSVTSKYELPKEAVPVPISGTPLFSEFDSDGYSLQHLTIYNPTNNSQQFDLTVYYLQPERHDVQRLGLAGRRYHSDPSLLNRLEKVLFGTMARLGVGFTPVIGDVADIYELLTGRDFVTNEHLDWPSRLLSGVGLLAGSGAGYRYALRATHAPEQFASQFEKGFSKIARRELQLSGINKAETRSLLAEAKSAEQGIKASPTLSSRYKNGSFKKTDFFVRPNGEVIPAKGYKYISSESHELQSVVKDGVLPGRGTSSSPHYITFNEFDNSVDVVKRLQLPKDASGKLLNDARYRIEFNTKQTLDKLEVPRGSWGNAEYLEPLTKDFPQFGEGGATQAILRDAIQIDKVFDLRAGKIIFQRAGK